jgi:hypothetical protein
MYKYLGFMNETHDDINVKYQTMDDERQPDKYQ